MKRDAAPIGEPLPGIGMNGVQLASGAGVSQLRANISRVAEDGASADHPIGPQPATTPASNTRDMKVPDGTYGLMCSQSTVTNPPPTLKSLNAGRIEPAIAIASV